jgi:GNAT superfamily N-acetyltransferase
MGLEKVSSAEVRQSGDLQGGKVRDVRASIAYSEVSRHDRSRPSDIRSSMQPEWEVVEIQKADGMIGFEAHFAEIDSIFFESSAKQDFCSPEERSSFRERLVGRYAEKHRESFFVALDDAKRAIGYLAGCLENPSDLHHFDDIAYFKTIQHICRLYPAHFHVNIATQHRNQGVGTLLVERFVDWAKIHSVAGIHIVTAQTSRSVPFYRRSGFRELLTFPWNSGVAVCMGRKI